MERERKHSYGPWWRIVGRGEMRGRCYRCITLKLDTHTQARMRSHAAARESRTELNEGIARSSRLDGEMRLGAQARRNCLFFSSGLFRAVWNYGWREEAEGGGGGGRGGRGWTDGGGRGRGKDGDWEVGLILDSSNFKVTDKFSKVGIK